jgi:hypothetical protein
MAAIGFNICIIARDLNKINQKLKYIEEKNKVKTLAVVFDFSIGSTI